MQIKIIDIPPGEAPEEVRQAWVGLVLPVAFSRRRRFKSTGVVSGPTSRIGSFLAIRRGDFKRENGYAVAGRKAIEILSQHSPEAAEWWREHAPRFLARGRYLVFADEVCEVFDASDVDEVPMGVRGQFARLLARVGGVLIVLGICTPLFAAGSARPINWGLVIAMIILGLGCGVCAAWFARTPK